MAVFGCFVGWGPVLLVWDPTDKKKSDPKKSKRGLKIFFVAVSKKMCFRRKQSEFSSFSALGAPYRGRAH